ncbi:MAG: hypothetical protein M1837_002350 [Sclerophora amabilis]|nr:MAG: hypothetical protein M1837_002350 [Sclerophora amabilis]
MDHAPDDPKPKPKSMQNSEAVDFLQTFLGRQLRVTATDGRIFVGEMKCTDNERNVILARTQEYRQPSESAIRKATASERGISSSIPSTTVKLDMTSRFLGLVVVPGQHITKIEVEESLRRAG